MGEYFELIGDYYHLTELNEFQKVDFSIYPNPANNVLTIDFKAIDSDVEEIVLTDLQGKNVINIQSTDLMKSDRTFEIDTLNLLPGCYFISLRTRNGSYQKKLQVVTSVE